jgi:hypothetical protein
VGSMEGLGKPEGAGSGGTLMSSTKYVNASVVMAITPGASPEAPAVR